MRKVLCALALLGASSAAVSQEIRSLPDLASRFVASMRWEDYKDIRNVEEVSSVADFSENTSVCGEITSDNENWHRFYIPAGTRRLTVYPHDQVTAAAGEAQAKVCKSLAAEVLAGRGDRAVARRACVASKLFAEARYEQAEFNLEYMAICRGQKFRRAHGKQIPN